MIKSHISELNRKELRVSRQTYAAGPREGRRWHEVARSEEQ